MPVIYEETGTSPCPDDLQYWKFRTSDTTEDWDWGRNVQLTCATTEDAELMRRLIDDATVNDRSQYFPLDSRLRELKKLKSIIKTKIFLSVFVYLY